jgi:hypothetical protein
MSQAPKKFQEEKNLLNWASLDKSLAVIKFNNNKFNLAV